ncbi:hypothetical protein RUND412_011109, partial [Rhizina undulata]
RDRVPRKGESTPVDDSSRRQARKNAVRSHRGGTVVSICEFEEPRGCGGRGWRVWRGGWRDRNE